MSIRELIIKKNTNGKNDKKRLIAIFKFDNNKKNR
jgi:hypothetical protein